jgi:hypothetical protein
MSIQHSFIPSVNKQKVKLFVAVPTKDQMYAHFAYALQAMVQYNAILGIDTQVEFNLGTLIGNQREKLARCALEANATHILWLDSDMMFPKNICETLLGHNLPIVACNYSTRALPLKSVAYTSLSDWTSCISRDQTGLVWCAGVGMGCVLTRTEIFTNLPKPWFPITYDETADDYLGEDMNFWKRVTTAGFDIAIDCDTSQHVFHIGTSAFLWNKPLVDTAQVE